MNKENIRNLYAVYRNGLLEDTIPFWLRHGFDREYGGIMTCLDRQGRIVDTDKNIWQQGRFAWTMANLYNTVERRDDWLEAASRTIDFILEHGFDSDGRMFFHVTRNGIPIRKRRYAFSESFAAIAFAACARAVESDYYAERARDCFRIFRDCMLRPGGMRAKFTGERPMKNIAPLMISIAAAQVLRENIDFPEANAIIDAAIDEIRRDFMKPELKALAENVGPHGEIIDHFDGRLLTPGHAIECAWFILDEAAARGGDSTLTEIGTTILDWMWERGWDNEYGGILYFRDLYNLPVQEYWQDMKFWWPQNETIIATLMAYSLTGNEKYFRQHALIHDWTYRHFPDPEYGEWFGYLHRDGSLSTPLKGSMWKGPFHMPRMQLVCSRILAGMDGCDKIS